MSHLGDRVLSGTCDSVCARNITRGVIGVCFATIVGIMVVLRDFVLGCAIHESAVFPFPYTDIFCDGTRFPRTMLRGRFGRYKGKCESDRETRAARPLFERN